MYDVESFLEKFPTSGVCLLKLVVRTAKKVVVCFWSGTTAATYLRGPKVTAGHVCSNRKGLNKKLGYPYTLFERLSVESLVYSLPVKEVEGAQ